MQTKWKAAVVTIAVAAQGCGAEYRRKDRATRAKQEELEEKLSASEEARTALSAESELLRARMAAEQAKLKEASEESERLKASLDSANRGMQEKTLEISLLTESLAGLRSELTAKDGEITKLESDLDAREREYNLLVSSADSSGLNNEQLRAKLAAAEAARDKALSDLKTAKEEKTRIQRALAEQKGKTLQAFLENVAPDSMFAADTSDLERLYKLEGRNCAIVLDLAREIEVVRGPARDKLPLIRGFDTLPIQVAFKKAMVCMDGSQLRVHREEGFLYRVVSDLNSYERAFLTARVKGTCDSRSADVMRSNVFGENPYQFINPYHGSIDGIETIDLPRTQGVGLRVHMGSAVTGATSCAQAAESGDPQHIVTIACKALLEKPFSPPVPLEVGCFAELKGPESTVLQFHK